MHLTKSLKKYRQRLDFKGKGTGQKCNRKTIRGYMRGRGLNDREMKQVFGLAGYACVW